MKNRIHLGSRLDVAKIADSLEQIRSSTERLAALTFDVGSEDDAWLRAAVNKQSDKALVWHIAMGYPSEITPIDLFKTLSINFHPSLQVIDWTAHLSASLTMDYAIDTFELAEFIHSVIVMLYDLDSTKAVDLALEYE